jgi:hypothetical protein
VGDTLNAELGYIFAISILDAGILSWIALRWYRRSVSRVMTASERDADVADIGLEDFRVASLPANAPHPVKSGPIDPGYESDGDLPALVPSAIRRRLVIAYVTGAALYSVVMSVAMFAQEPIDPGRLVTMFWMNMWPVVPAVGALLAYEWVRSIRVLGFYALCGSGAVALVTLVTQVGRGELTSAPVTNVLWATAALVLTACVPFVLLLVTGWRRIRAVTPLALASTLLFGLGLLVFRRAIVQAFDIPSLNVLFVSLSEHASVPAMFYALFLLLALPVGWLAWRALRWLAAAYNRKLFSDVQLIVDCWFVIVTSAGIAIHLAAPLGWRGVAVGIAAFAAYRVGVTLSLRALPLRTDERPSRRCVRLLLLRVFGYQVRTEQLFDRVAQQWRLHGPVQLIAGRDLAMRTANPGNILAFITGRVKEQFVSSLADIQRRINSLDVRRDPDGRFRINDLYCLNHTWQSTLQALLTVTDVVVMDLRGFSKKNSGCRFELEQLVARIAPERIVLIADKTTDKTLLTEILRDSWARASPARATLQGGSIALIPVERNSRHELNAVMRRLLGWSEPSQLLALSENRV